MSEENKFIGCWIRVNSQTRQNIIRLLSPRPYNPFKVPIEKRINEEEGTITFSITDTGNLFDKNLQQVIILDLPVGSTRFILERVGNYVEYYHISPKVGVRLAKLDISQIFGAKKLFFAFTWSNSESKLYVGSWKPDKFMSATAKNLPSKVAVGKDGSVFIIGDEGIDVGILYVKKGGEITLEPTAKEIFDFHIERINNLIERLPSGDFLLESTVVQMGIVMLVSAFEAYFKKRFVELEKEGCKPNIDELLKAIFSSKWESYKEELEQIAQKENKSIVELLASGTGKGRFKWGVINFQDFDECKKVFKKCYGIKFGEIVRSQVIEKVRQFIKYRHEIIHSGRDMTILNYDELPSKEPIFSTKRTLEEARNVFKEFIDKVHEATLGAPIN